MSEGNIKAIKASKPGFYKVPSGTFLTPKGDGPFPTVFADLMCTADGRKAFHFRRMGIRLVPDWPMATMPALIHRARQDQGEVAEWAQCLRTKPACHPKSF